MSGQDGISSPHECRCDDPLGLYVCHVHDCEECGGRNTDHAPSCRVRLRAERDAAGPKALRDMVAMAVPGTMLVIRESDERVVRMVVVSTDPNDYGATEGTNLIRELQASATQLRSALECVVAADDDPPNYSMHSGTCRRRPGACTCHMAKARAALAPPPKAAGARPGREGKP